MNDNSKAVTASQQGHQPEATLTTKEDAARIQSSQAKAGHDTGKGSFAARAQSAADSHQDKSKR
jgi:hypothetical protein